jgi:hypothetical protein
MLYRDFSVDELNPISPKPLNKYGLKNRICIIYL